MTRNDMLFWNALALLIVGTVLDRWVFLVCGVAGYLIAFACAKPPTGGQS